jgi:hypothetical protein
MDCDFYWADDDSYGQGIARKYALKSPHPIMCSSPESDNCMYMFQSGSRYYLWNLSMGDIWEIVTVMNGVDIVTKIAKQGLKSPKLAEIHQGSTSGLENAVDKLL